MAEKSFVDFAEEQANKPKKDRGFLESLYDVTAQGISQTKSATGYADDIAAGEFDENTAKDLAKDLISQQNNYVPPELNEIQHAFDDEAQDWNKAKGFFESAGVAMDFLGEGIKQVATNPKGLLYFTGEQAGNMLPGMAATIAGAGVGAATGAAVSAPTVFGVPVGTVVGGLIGAAGRFGSSWSIEAGAKLQEVVGQELSNRGLQITEDNIKSLLNDPVFARQAVDRARGKALGTAGVDAILGGITAGLGPQVAKATTKKLLKKGALGTLEFAGEGISEAAGQLLAEGNVDPKEIALEMMGGGIGAYTTALGASGKTLSKLNKKAKAELEAEAETNKKVNVAEGNEPESILEDGQVEEEIIEEAAVEEAKDELNHATAAIEEELHDRADEEHETHQAVKEAVADTGIDKVELNNFIGRISETVKTAAEFTRQLVAKFGEGIKKHALKLWNMVKSERGSVSYNRTLDSEIKKNGTEWATNQLATRERRLQKNLAKGAEETSFVVKALRGEIAQLKEALGIVEEPAANAEIPRENAQQEPTPTNGMPEEEKPKYSAEETQQESKPTVTPKNNVPAAEKIKAPFKASKATKYIGFGKEGSSTDLYSQQLEDSIPVNDDKYNDKDVVFVSINGSPSRADFNDTLALASQALESGAMVLTDSEEYLAKSRYNKGEQALAKALLEAGYTRQTTKGNKDTAIWTKKKAAKQDTTAKPSHVQTEAQTQPTPATGINISSYESGLGRRLTNFAKEPMFFRGVKYSSSEEAYQRNKPKDLSDASVQALMDEILTERLKQQPDLVAEIDAAGGIEFLNKSTHKLIKRDGTEIKRNDRWVSTGKDMFMKSLRKAYTNIKNNTLDQEQPTDEDLNFLNQVQTDAREEESAPFNPRDPKFKEVFGEDLIKYVRMFAPVNITEKSEQKAAIQAVTDAVEGKFLSRSKYNLASEYLDRYLKDESFKKSKPRKTTILRKGEGREQVNPEPVTEVAPSVPAGSLPLKKKLTRPEMFKQVAADVKQNKNETDAAYKKRLNKIVTSKMKQQKKRFELQGQIISKSEHVYSAAELQAMSMDELIELAKNTKQIDIRENNIPRTDAATPSDSIDSAKNSSKKSDIGTKVDKNGNKINKNRTTEKVTSIIRNKATKDMSTEELTTIVTGLVNHTMKTTRKVSKIANNLSFQKSAKLRKETIEDLAEKDKYLIDKDITEDERLALYESIYKDLLEADRNEDAEMVYNDLKTSFKPTVQDRLNEGESTSKPYKPSHKGAVSEAQQESKAESLINKELDERKREFSPLVNVSAHKNRTKASQTAIDLAKKQMEDSELLTLGEKEDKTSLRDMIISKLDEYARYGYNVPLIIKRIMASEKTVSFKTLTEYPVLFDEIDSYLNTIYGEDHLTEEEAAEALTRAELNIKKSHENDQSMDIKPAYSKTKHNDEVFHSDTAEGEGKQKRPAHESPDFKKEEQKPLTKKELIAQTKANQEKEKKAEEDRLAKIAAAKVAKSEKQVKKDQAEREKKRKELEAEKGERLNRLYEHYKKQTKLLVSIPEIFTTLLADIDTFISGLNIHTAKKLNASVFATRLGKYFREEGISNKFTELTHKEQIAAIKLTFKIANSIKIGETFTKGKEKELYLAEIIDQINDINQLGEAFNVEMIDMFTENPENYKFLNVGGQYLQDISVDFGIGDPEVHKLQKFKEIEAFEEMMGVEIRKIYIVNGKKLYNIGIRGRDNKHSKLINGLTKKEVDEIKNKQGVTALSEKQNFSDNMVIDVSFYDKANGTWKKTKTIPYLTYRRLKNTTDNIKAVGVVHEHVDHGLSIKAKMYDGTEGNLTFESFKKLKELNKGLVSAITSIRKSSFIKKNKDGSINSELSSLNELLSGWSSIDEETEASTIQAIITNHIKNSPLGNENVLEDMVATLRKEKIEVSKLQLLEAYIDSGGNKDTFKRSVSKLMQDFYQERANKVFAELDRTASDEEIFNHVILSLRKDDVKSFKEYLTGKVSSNLTQRQLAEFVVVKNTYNNFIALRNAVEKNATNKQKEDIINRVTSYADNYLLQQLVVSVQDIAKDKETLSHYEEAALADGSHTGHEDLRVMSLRSPIAQQFYKMVAKIFGADLVIVSSETYRSRYIPGNVRKGTRSQIVVNLNDSTPFSKIYAHELFHHLVNKADPAAYNTFKKALLEVAEFSPQARANSENMRKSRYEKEQLINQLKRGDDIMQEEYLAELFAWAVTQPTFYKHLAKTIQGKNLASKMIKRLLEIVDAVNAIQPRQEYFSYAGQKLVGEKQLTEVYDLIHDLVGNAYHSTSQRRSGQKHQRYHTLNATKEEIQGYLSHPERWLKGAWNAVFPKGTKNYKDVMTNLEKVFVKALKIMNKMKPVGMMSDWLADMESVRLAHLVSNMAEKTVAKANLKTKKYKKVIKNFVLSKQESVKAELENKEWYIEITKDKEGNEVRKYKHRRKEPAKGATIITIDPSLKEHQRFSNDIMFFHSKKHIMERMHDEFVRGLIDVSTTEGRERAKALGYSDEVIEAFAAFKTISDELFDRLKKIFPDLQMLKSHYGQSLQWFNKKGEIQDAAMDAILNPELNEKASKLNGKDNITLGKNLKMSTAEIAEEYGLTYKTIDPHEMLMDYIRNAEKLINMDRLIKEGKASGRVRVFSNAQQAAIYGFEAVNDNATKIMRDLRTVKGFFLVNGDGEVFKKNDMDLVFNTEEEAKTFHGLMSKSDKAEYQVEETEQEGKSAIPYFAVYRNGKLVDYFNDEKDARAEAARLEELYGDPGTKEEDYKDAVRYRAKGVTVQAKTSEVARYYFHPDLAKMLNNLFAKDHIRDNKILGVSGNSIMNLKNNMTSIEFMLSGFHFLTIGHEMLVSYMSWSMLKNRQLKENKVGFFERMKDMNPSRIWNESREITALFEYALESEGTEREGEAKAAAQKRLGEILKTDDLDVVDLVDMFFHAGGLMKQDRSLRSDIHDHAEMKYVDDDKIDINDNGDPIYQRGKASKAVFMNSIKEAMEEEKARNPNNPLLRKFNMARFVSMEAGSAWLMEGFIPKVKMAMWAREYTMNLKKYETEIAAGSMTHEEVARHTMKFIEDRFGEVNWRNMWMNPTIKTSLQFLFRSFTWMVGSWKALGKAGIDIGKTGWFKLKGEEYELTEKGWWGINAILVHMLTVAAINVAFKAITSLTGEGDDDDDDEDTPLLARMLFPRMDALDPSGRYTVPSYITELYKIMQHTGAIGVHAEPWKLVSGRTNSLLSNSIEAISGQDWRGVNVRNEDDGLIMDSINTLAHIFNIMPISISTIVADTRTHGFRPQFAAYGLLGMTSAPAAAKRSNAVTLAYVLRRNEHRGSSIDADKMELRDDVKKAAYKFANGNRKPLIQMRMKQEITKKQFENAIARLPRIDGKKNPKYVNPLSAALKNLSIEGSIKVWEEMTDNEKKAQRFTLIKKFQNIRKLNTRTIKEQKKIYEDMTNVGILKAI